MEIDYTFPGSIKISLDQADLSLLRMSGFTMDRNGFAGIENKTWVYSNRDPAAGPAHANIDGDGDLVIHIPSDQTSSLTIEREQITAVHSAAIEHYLGATGVVVVEWPVI